MRVGFARGLPPAGRLGRCARGGGAGGGVGVSNACEALRLLGCAWTGWCDPGVPLGPPPPGAEPPIYLIQASNAGHAVVYDHDSLYTRVAIATLERAGLPGLAERGRRLLALKTGAPPEWLERYVLVSQESVFARLFRYGDPPSRSRRCRRFWEEAGGEPPLRYEEAIEVMSREPCRIYAIRVKDVVKYAAHAAVGYSKWTNGLYYHVVAEARRVVLGAARWLAERGVAIRRVYVDSYELEGGLDGRAPPQWREYPVKLEADGEAVALTPATYRVGAAIGYWGVWLEDGEIEPVPAAPGVYEWPSEEEWYTEAARVMRGERPPERSRGLLEREAKRFGLRVEWGPPSLRVEDKRAGEWRQWDVGAKTLNGQLTYKVLMARVTRP